jgi:hypothetical protein
VATEKKTSSAEEPTASADDLGADQVQAAFDEANEKGYFGETPDDTPNENYTVQGVTSGKPTPETERGK